MSYFDYSFEAPVSTHDVGSSRYLYTVVWLDPDLVKTLPLKAYPKLRIVGEINDVPFRSALTPVRGRWYILLSKTQLREMNASVGDNVDVRFSIDDQDAVDVPEALAAALKTNAPMAKLWDELTPGKQRGLAYRVASAKTEPTQKKRVEEVFDIMTGKRDQRGKLIAK
ncbi:MAG: YdeI/OmpD-associated family protein [Pseudomonadota bacterium]